MLFIAAFIVTLVAGDFASTFFYHVPQHLWFTLHLRTHHDRRRSYFDHAVISANPAVLLDGLLGALPYLAIALLASRLSWPGAVAALAAGQLHVLVAARHRPGLANAGVAKNDPAPARCGAPRGPRWPPPKPRHRVWRYLPLLRCAGSGAFGLVRSDEPAGAQCRPARDEEGGGQSLIGRAYDQTGPSADLGHRRRPSQRRQRDRRGPRRNQVTEPLRDPDRRRRRPLRLPAHATRTRLQHGAALRAAGLRGSLPRHERDGAATGPWFVSASRSIANACATSSSTTAPT